MTDLDGIHRSINELQRLVGGLVQANENAESQRRTMFKKHDETMRELRGFGQELLTLRHEHNSLDDTVTQMRPHVADFKKMKQRAIGLMVAIATAASSTGVAVMRWLSSGPPDIPTGGD